MLVLLAQQGDRAALDELLERSAPRLFRYIRGILSGSQHPAEDVLQETLFRIARKLPSLTEPLAFDRWTYRIATNETHRAVGQSLRRGLEEPLNEDLEIPEQPAPALTPEQMQALIAELSPGSRAVLVLHYQEERPLDEIADILSLPLGTVKSRLAYGLKCLRRKFQL